MKSISTDYSELYDFFMQAPAPFVILLGEELRFAMANPPYLRLVGRSVVGKTVLEAFTESEVGDFIPLVKGVYKTGQPFIGKELSLRIPDESGKVEQRYINVSYHPFRASDGTIKGVYALHEDVTEQVRARKIIEASHSLVEQERENFRKLFKDTPELVCILKGANHVFEFVNEAHIRVLGFDATGKSVREAQPESVEVHHILDGVYQTGVTAELHEIPVTVGTKRRYFNLTYAARRNISGEIDGIMILGKEITENVRNAQIIKSALQIKEIQKRALELALKEAPLHESLALLTTMVESQTQKKTFASILLLDDSGRRLLHGAAPNLPDDYNNAIHGVEIGPEVGSCGTCAYFKETVIVSDIATHPLWRNFKDLALSFTLRACWSTPILSSSGELLGTFALYHHEIYEPLEGDKELVAIATSTASILIERHHLSRKRVDAEERLRLAHEGGQMGTWTVELPEFRILTDERFREMHFVTESEVIELPLGCRPLPEDQSLIEEAYRRATDDDEPFICEYRIPGPNGSPRWIYARGEAKKNPDSGKALSISGVVFDITEQKATEEKLRAAISTRDEFLSIASHELKTPLTSLKLQNQLLMRLEEHGDYQRLKMSLPKIDRIISRMTRLIDDMLDISRIQTGKLPIRKEHADLARIVQDVLDKMNPSFSEITGSHLVFTGPQNCPGYFDPLRMEQVITNLLQNSLRYAQGKGVKIILEETSDFHILAVKDEGPGIPGTLHEKIFDRFERATGQDEMSGLGLGLYICRKIVDAHQGKIWVESQVGSGANFLIRLPKSQSLHYN